MTRLARFASIVVALVAAAIGGSAPVANAADSATTTAVIVIDTGDEVRTAFVDVGSGMSGLEALDRVADITTYSYAGNGGAVCRIDGVGNEATQAACLVGPGSRYWAYYHSAAGANAWSYSRAGAGAYIVRGGDVEGWRYGTTEKPEASPVFCDYASCPAPPATTSTTLGGGAGGGGSGSGGGSAGETGAGSGIGPTAGAAGAAGVDRPAGAPPTDDPAQATTTTTTSSPEARDRNGAGNEDGVRAEATSLTRDGGDDGSGSPVGVVVAAGLLAIVGGAIVWLRRRTRAPG